MIDVFLDALLDSIKTFGFIFIVYVVLSFFENKIAVKLSKESKITPVYGAMLGLIPQCGVSIVASDLYLKSHITMGTLVAVFISCNDEALPLLIAQGNSKSLTIIPLIILKFVIGFISGYLIDVIIKNKKVAEHVEHCDHNDIGTHVGCCNHNIEEENNLKLHFIYLHYTCCFIKNEII